MKYRCNNKLQDTLYGKNRRVCDEVITNTPARTFRCTWCGVLHTDKENYYAKQSSPSA